MNKIKKGKTDSNEKDVYDSILTTLKPHLKTPSITFNSSDIFDDEK